MFNHNKNIGALIYVIFGVIILFTLLGFVIQYPDFLLLTSNSGDIIVTPNLFYAIL